VSLEIELRGLVVHGFHGVLDEERREGQPFVFDVRLVGGEEAARTDDVADTIDYRRVASAVVDVSSRRRYHLLEALAAAVADELVRAFPVERVRVRVRKPAVRLAAPVDYAAVTVDRTR
jgi:7,8-dihydroneopterin aldolase/epimerase/oxygenase